MFLIEYGARILAGLLTVERYLFSFQSELDYVTGFSIGKIRDTMKFSCCY